MWSKKRPIWSVFFKIVLSNATVVCIWTNALNWSRVPVIAIILDGEIDDIPLSLSLFSRIGLVP